jgi:hypothetical protein
VAQPTVTSEYCEDLPEDVEQEGDWAYRYWQYIFDFGSARYRARVYVDQPQIAYVIGLDGDPTDPLRDEVLRVVAQRLDSDGVRELQMLGASGAFGRVFP